MMLQNTEKRGELSSHKVFYLNKWRFISDTVFLYTGLEEFVAAHKTIHVEYLNKSHDSLKKLCD